MKFGIHHSSWLDSPDSAEAFETVKVKARWAEEHGFVWFSVMDHVIQIPGVGAPEGPVSYSDSRNDVETRELFASDVMPHFA